jgi:hypothetical protein
MRTRATIAALVFACAAIAPAAAEKVDYIQFVNFEVNLFQMLILGETVDMGSGLIVDFNSGPLLWHIGARVQYLNGFGLAGEAGVGYLLDAKYETQADFVQIIPIRTWDVGNIRYTEYQRTEGKCPAAFLHVAEAGVKPHYLTSESYNWQSDFYDVIFYGGYRYVTYFAEFAPNQEIEVQVHALIGLTGRYLYDWGTETRDDGRLAFGFEAGLKWYILHANVAFYDGFFYMDFGFRIPITIM